MKKNVFIALFWVWPALVSIKAQQYPHFTQFTFNKFIMNPASAGVDGYTTASVIAREQWIGIGGSPKTHGLVIDSRILGDSYILKKLSIRKKGQRKSTSGNTAWGAYIINDANGPINRTWINGTYTYHISMGDYQLSFGLSMLLFQNRLNSERFIQVDDQLDPAYIEGKQAFWILDGNFGAILTSREYFAGYSTVQFLNSAATFGSDRKGLYKLNRQHNLVGGYRFEISSNIELEPAVMIRIPESFNAQIDISAKALFNKEYWAGLNFKTGSALAVFGGIKYDKFYFGYAFEYDFNSIAKQSYGTHEFMITMRIGDSSRRFKWLNTY